MSSKSPKIFFFLLLLFLLQFIQFSSCEVESNDKRFSSSEPSSHYVIKKRAPSIAESALDSIQIARKLINNW
jgi:hypothetical protein